MGVLRNYCLAICIKNYIFRHISVIDQKFIGVNYFLAIRAQMVNDRNMSKMYPIDTKTDSF
jgi:hypothetical protein